MKWLWIRYMKSLMLLNIWRFDMRGKKAKELRSKVYEQWVGIRGSKVSFKTVFRRVKKAYVRGLVKY